MVGAPPGFSSRKVLRSEHDSIATANDKGSVLGRIVVSDTVIVASRGYFSNESSKPKAAVVEMIACRAFTRWSK